MQSVLNTLRVFEEVSARQPVGVSELTRAMGCPKSSVQRCLITLQEAGWLKLDSESARWSITAKALTLGLRASEEPDLRSIALPVMKKVGDNSQETVHVSVLDKHDTIIVARHDSTQGVRTYVEIGRRVPLHASSAGVAALAALPDDDVDAILATPLARYTETSITDPAALKEELAATANRGYALNHAWWRPHVIAIGAAILNGLGRPVGGIAVSVPDIRFTEERGEELGRIVSEAAQEISTLIARIDPQTV